MKLNSFFKNAALTTTFAAALGMASMTAMAGPNHKHEKHANYLIEKLELTSEQQAQYDNLRANKKEQLEPLHVQMKEVKKQLRAASSGSDFNDAEVRTLLHKQADLKADMMAQKNDHRQQFQAILTSDQKEKLQVIKAEKKAKMKAKYKKHHEKMNKTDES